MPNVDDSKNKNWRLFLSRPFSLLGASLWHEWYSSQLCKEIFGVNLNGGLMIENPKGVVRYYRDADEEDKLFIAFDKFASPERISILRSLLNEALSLNKQAEEMVEGKNELDLKSLVNFYIRLALLSTMLPFRVGEVAVKKNVDPEI